MTRKRLTEGTTEPITDFFCCCCWHSELKMQSWEAQRGGPQPRAALIQPGLHPALPVPVEEGVLSLSEPDSDPFSFRLFVFFSAVGRGKRSRSSPPGTRRSQSGLTSSTLPRCGKCFPVDIQRVMKHNIVLRWCPPCFSTKTCCIKDGECFEMTYRGLLC